MIRKLLHTVVETMVQPIELNVSIKTESLPFEWIASSTPCFPVIASNISILTQPDQFYKFLLKCCKEAKNRVTLASLYLGTGKLEEKLVHALANNHSFRNNELEINILLDYTRGSRSDINSRTMLLPLLQANDRLCHISLYHTPVLRGLTKKYLTSPWNELLGLQHMKVYIFDDILIISGANLSNDYFTNRQDRYYVIKDKKLSDFYCGLVNKIQNFSLKMDKNNQLALHESWNLYPYEGSKSDFIKKAKGVIEEYFQEVKTVCPSKLGSDTYIFPLVQMGQLGIEHDRPITNRILAEAVYGTEIKFATGYFNLTDEYVKTLIHQSKAHCDILMAHPKANGFLGAKWPAGGIPYAYSLLARQFEKKLEKSGQNFRIKLFEYLRDNWTYHAKGLWYYPPHSIFPCMTLIGSPNLGQRSANRDLESQIAIVTNNQQLKEDLHKEWLLLYGSAIPADTKRPVPKWVHMFILIFRSFF